MKIAITADIHLKTKAETPERYNALEYIFKEIKQREIDELLIAGDTFNKEFSNYHDFNSLCEKYKGIRVTVIPGNHDPEIEKRFFTAGNLEIIDKPLIKEIGGLNILFIPYVVAKTLDEVLTEYIHSNEIPDRWLLIGHGDYITANRQMNPYEPGFYMPVSSKTINKYNPLRVILGHIHKQSEHGKVIYPGSPCGLDITETGKRKFIIYDTIINSIETPLIQTDVIYFIESVLNLPIEDETEVLKNKIEQMITRWQLTPEEFDRVKLRLRFMGFTRNLDALKNFIIAHLKERCIHLYDPDALDLSSIQILKDIDEERISILNKVKAKIESLQSYGVLKDKILEGTMEIIFGE
ncbi:MAG: metallophosphoesterase [Ignavibacteriaceae bacterium]|nr:metallophosphoesterase [Ignavibacteriaceae bacterium]